MTMSMEQIHQIKQLQLKQKGPYQIAKELKMDPKTVRRYMAMEDFSPKSPIPEERSSVLDPYKPTIEKWLKEDEQNRYKQRHTSQRVYTRLTQTFQDFNCSFGTERTDTVDWLSMLDQLISKPNAWKNSVVRNNISYDLRDYMDDQDKSGLKQVLKLMKDLSGRYGLDIAITSLQETIVRQRTEGISINAAVVAAQIANYGLNTPSEPGPDMSQYDVLLPVAGGIAHGPQ